MTAERKSCNRLGCGPWLGQNTLSYFPGEGVAVVVLQQTARTDDDRRLAEVFEHLGEFLDEIFGKAARQDAVLGLFDVVEKTVRVPLLLPQPPATVLDEERAEDVRADEERIVVLRAARSSAGRTVLRMARARSMPTDFPPINPEPIMRFQISSTSGSVR